MYIYRSIPFKGALESTSINRRGTGPSLGRRDPGPCAGTRPTADSRSPRILGYTNAFRTTVDSKELEFGYSCKGAWGYNAGSELIDPKKSLSSRFQKVGGDSIWLTFFVLFWDQRVVIFQLSGLECE